MSDDGLRRKATRSIGWVVIERWSSRIISLAVLAVLTRLIGPDDFGVISLATVFVAVLQVFVDSGFSKALIQKKELGPKDASTAFWTSLTSSIVLAAALVAAAPWLSALLGEPTLAPVLQVLAAGLPISALSRTPAALLERDFGFKALSIRQVIGAFAGAVVAVPMALFGFGVWALVAQILGTSLVAVITLWASTPWRPRWEFSWQSFRSLWAVGVTVLGIELLDAVQANIDKLVIGAFFTTNELGVYYLAQRIGTILVELVTTVISRVSFTTFSRVQDDPERLNRIFRQLTFAASAVSIPIFGLVALLSPQIVPFVFGPNWEDSIPILWVLAPGWALAAVMYFDRTVLLATGHAKTALSLALFQNVVGIGLVFALVPFGVLGVAFSRLARIVTWPVRLAILRRVASIDVWAYLLQMFRCLAAIALPLVAVGLLQTTPWAAAPAPFWTFAAPLAVAGMAFYAAALWLLAGEENRAVLRSMIGEATAKLRRRRSA